MILKIDIQIGLLQFFSDFFNKYRFEKNSAREIDSKNYSIVFYGEFHTTIDFLVKVKTRAPWTSKTSAKPAWLVQYHPLGSI